MTTHDQLQSTFREWVEAIGGREGDGLGEYELTITEGNWEIIQHDATSYREIVILSWRSDVLNWLTAGIATMRESHENQQWEKLVEALKEFSGYVYMTFNPGAVPGHLWAKVEEALALAEAKQVKA